MGEESCKYIFSKGELIQNDFSILFKANGKNNYLPVKNMKELYLFSDCTLTTKFLEMCSNNRITIHLFDYYGYYKGTFYPKITLLSGDLIVKQALVAYYDREIIAKAIVQGIANNIYDVEYHYYRHKVNEIKPYLDYLKNDVSLLLSKCTNVKQIMAVEGSIWAKFYNTFQYFLPKDFIFNKRVRRPPDNPINALISFGNSLLYSKTITQIYKTHLNQTISFLHQPSDARFSLSLDLSEVFKPVIVFKTIFDCINNKKITVEKHFDKNVNYCYLNEIGRKIFITEFDKRLNSTFNHSKLHRAVTYNTAIRLDGYKLIKFLIENKPFVPFNIKDKC